MKRREVLQWAAASGILTGCKTGSNTPGEPDPNKPNILMIAIDDLNDWVGFLGGHPQVKTPALDALAATAHVFKRAYCTVPVCSGSRASALSGLSPQSTGVYDLSATFRSVNGNKRQYDQMLADFSGYTTVRIGKVDHEFEGSSIPWQLPPQPNVNKQCFAMTGTGAFDWGATTGLEEELPDYQYAQQAINFLNRQGADPFCLSVGFFRPHIGWYVPQRFFDMYPLEGLHLPAAPTDDLDDLGPIAKEIALKWNFHDCIIKQSLWAEAVRAYLAAITWVDTQVGRVLAALEASPHAANTLVVLWSDHGLHLGEKFHWFKMALWEHATRIPFLIRLPGQTVGRSNDACVSLQDMAPTLLDYCHTLQDYPMDGQSLRPLLEGVASDSWTRPVLSTWEQYHYAVRTPDWRYIRYKGGAERELYDELNDPWEYHNLASDPKYSEVIAALEKYMPPVV